MKKYIFVVFLITSFSILSAQKISFNDFPKMIELNFEDLESFLTLKGFEYYSTKTDALSKSYCYSFKDNQFISAYMCKFFDYDGGGYVSFQCDITSYNKIKNEGKLLGIKLVKSEDAADGNGYYHQYTYKNYLIEFWTAKSTINIGQNVYEISIERK